MTTLYCFMTDLLKGYCRQMKGSYGITFSAKKGVEINFKSIESLKTIISPLSRPFVRMIDSCCHLLNLGEKCIMKLNHC